MSKYKGKLNRDDVNYLVNRLGFHDKYAACAYKYFVEGKNASSLGLRSNVYPDFIKKCEETHEFRTTGGVLKKWLYGIGG